MLSNYIFVWLTSASSQLLMLKLGTQGRTTVETWHREHTDVSFTFHRSPRSHPDTTVEEGQFRTLNRCVASVKHHDGRMTLGKDVSQVSSIVTVGQRRMKNATYRNSQNG